MADKLHATAVGGVKVRLKGEHHGQLIDPFGNGVDPPSAPRPHLGADVVEHRHAGLFGNFGDAQIELRKINQDQQVGRLGTEQGAELTIGANQIADFIAGLEQAHAGNRGAIDQGPHPGSPQRLSTNAEDFELRCPASQRADHVRAMRIA